MREYQDTLGQQAYSHLYYRSPKRRKERKLFEEIMVENFLNLAKETGIHDQEAQSPKPHEPRETHTKTHRNQNVKNCPGREAQLEHHAIHQKGCRFDALSGHTPRL